MNHQEIRLECLKLATQISQNQPLRECLQKAHIFTTYVLDGVFDSMELLDRLEKRVSVPALVTDSGT